MFIAVQVVLLLVGLYIMTRGRFQIGDRTIANPVASLVGIVLIAQLPIALLISIVLGLTAEPTASTVLIPTRAGEATPVQALAAPRSMDDNWWVDPLITCGAVVLAAAMTGIALRAESDTDDVFASLSPADGDRAQ
jgi:hypothetical protein